MVSQADTKMLVAKMPIVIGIVVERIVHSFQNIHRANVATTVPKKKSKILPSIKDNQTHDITRRIAVWHVLCT